MRVSWHEVRAGRAALWRDSVCTGSFRLAVDGVPALIELLRSGWCLYESARDRLIVVRHPSGLVHGAAARAAVTGSPCYSVFKDLSGRGGSPDSPGSRGNRRAAYNLRNPLDSRIPSWHGPDQEPLRAQGRASGRRS